MNARPRSAQLVAVCTLAAFLLVYPLLSLFNVPRLVLGIPVLFAYLFGVWLGVIVLAALAVELRG